MKIDWNEISGAVIGVGIFFVVFVAPVGIVGFQVYGYLHDGVWHWLTVADLVAASGRDPITVLDPSQTWEWVGVGNIANWFFYSAPASLVAFLVGAALLFLLAAVVAS